MEKHSYLANAHPAYIESLYKSYKENPASVDPSWQKFFEGFEFAASSNGAPTSPESGLERRKEVNVLNLINAYRTRGHLLR